MIISVTQEDIEKGSIGNPFECPVALALRREMPWFNFVRVSMYQIELGVFDDITTVVALPAEIVEWANKYHDAEQVNPIEFEMDYDS